MEIHQLKYASCIARHGSVSKAAEELYVSRQAISKAIKALEQELGCEIFDRDNGMRLTEFGEGAIAYIDKILQGLGELDIYVNSQEKTSEGKGIISVALTAFPLDFLFFNDKNEVSALIREFANRTQNCNLITYMLSDAAILSAIQNGTVDLGFVHGEYEKAGIKLFPISSMEMRVIAFKNNPLCEKVPIKIADLKDTPIRSPLDFDLYMQQFISRCRYQGFEPQFKEVPLNDDAIADFCNAGGVHIQPYDPLMEVKYPESAFLPFDANARNDLPLCLVYRESSLKPQAKMLVDFLKSNLLSKH